MSDKDEKVLTFLELTNSSDPEEALLLLEQNGWNLENSVNNYFLIHEDDNNQSKFTTNTTGSTGGGSGGSGGVSFVGDDDDNIRAPMTSYTDTMLDSNDIYDQFTGRTIPANRRRPPPQRVNNPFESFRNFQAEGKIPSYKPLPSSTSPTQKQTQLAELFKPPLDILSFGTFDQVKKLAESKKAFLLINVQDVTEFDCQKLNRDTWSHKGLKDYISNHFVFWQVSKDSNEGTYFTKIYPVQQYPYIAIVDPRTGRNLTNMQGKFVDSDQAYSFLQKFITSKEQPIGDSSGAESTTTGNDIKRQKRHTTEEEELEKAIQLSLQQSKTNDKEMKQRDDEEEEEEQEEEKDDEDQDIEEAEEEEEEEEPTGGDDEDLSMYEKEPIVPPPNASPIVDETIGTVGNCIIQIRLPSGEVLKGNFQEDDKLQKIYYYVTVKSGIKNFVLLTTFPKVELKGDLVSKSLKENDLIPRAMLVCHQIDQ